MYSPKVVTKIDALIEQITNAKSRDATFNVLLDELHQVMANTMNEATRAGYKKLLAKLYNGDLTSGE